MKNVLITGVTRGIGRACAVTFAKAGYRVYGVYKNSETEAERLERDLGITCYKCDVSDEFQVMALHDTVIGECGGIDVLINNAGVSLFGIFQTISNDDRRKMYATNLFGTLYVTREFVGDMINAKSGVIINISSVLGETGGSCEADYAASKGALIALTKSLAKECGPSGVRVNCVCPGIIDTDMNANLTADEVEELVGEIWDEHDKVNPEIEKVSNDEYCVAGGLNLDKFFEFFDLENKFPDITTVSGWIIEQLGRIPTEGEGFTYYNLKVTVKKKDFRRIIKVSIKVG